MIFCSISLKDNDIDKFHVKTLRNLSLKIRLSPIQIRTELLYVEQNSVSLLTLWQNF